MHIGIERHRKDWGLLAALEIVTYYANSRLLDRLWSVFVRAEGIKLPLSCVGDSYCVFRPIETYGGVDPAAIYGELVEAERPATIKLDLLLLGLSPCPIWPCFLELTKL